MAATLKPVLTISDMQARAIIDRVAPGRTLARVGELLAGEISAVFEIELTGGPPTFVLKVYPEALHWQMGKEVLIAGLLDGRLGVPVPRILLSDHSKSLIDLNFVVMNRFDGQDVLRLEPSFGPADSYALHAQMGRALREIHRIPMGAFGYIGPEGIVSPSVSNRAYMLSQFDRKLAGFAQFAGRPALAEQLSTYVERSAPLLDGCAQASLCHYDFHTGNVLAAQRNGSWQLTGIVDLANAIAGDPLMDLAKTVSYLGRDNDAKRAGLLAGYGTIDRPDWQETLALYQFYSAIELWAWWTQIGDHQRAAGIVADLERYA
jgi:aminoglycoside phosphotransferase (APT) family kinase protein